MSVFIIYRALGTNIYALTAVNALMISDVHGIGFAFCYAGIAACAFVFINDYTEKRDRIKERVDSAQRAYKPAESSVAYRTYEYAKDKYEHLPGKKPSDPAAQLSVCQDEREGCFKRSGRTDIFAEAGCKFDKRDEHDK